QRVDLIVLSTKWKVSQFFQELMVPSCSDDRDVARFNLRRHRCRTRCLGAALARDVGAITGETSSKICSLVLSGLSRILGQTNADRHAIDLCGSRNGGLNLVRCPTETHHIQYNVTSWLVPHQLHTRRPIRVVTSRR